MTSEVTGNKVNPNRYGNKASLDDINLYNVAEAIINATKFYLIENYIYKNCNFSGKEKGKSEKKNKPYSFSLFFSLSLLAPTSNK